MDWYIIERRIIEIGIRVIGGIVRIAKIVGRIVKIGIIGIVESRTGKISLVVAGSIIIARGRLSNNLFWM